MTTKAFTDRDTRDLRELVREYGEEAVTKKLEQVLYEEIPERRRSATERFRDLCEERGLKGDGTDIIDAKDAWPGDIVYVNNNGEAAHGYHQCTVVDIRNDKGTITVHLFRPYVSHSDFSTTSGLIPYLGFEQFFVWGSTKLVVVRPHGRVR